MRSMGLGQNRGGLGPTHWRDWRNLLSRRIGEVAGAFGRGGPIGRALAACRRKCLPHAFSIEIGGVHWCSGLLPPGVVQSAGINSIETEFVNKLQDDGFGPCIVARNGQGNSTRRSTRPTAFEQMARIDVIKRLDNGPSQFLFDPAAFRHSRLDFYNPAIALARIVVAGIHDDHARWHAGEQPFRQCRNITLRDGDYDQIHTSRGILRLNRDGTSFRHQARKSAGVSGIGHVNLVSQRSPPTGEGAADLTCAYDADFHDLSYGQSPYATNIAALPHRAVRRDMAFPAANSLA